MADRIARVTAAIDYALRELRRSTAPSKLGTALAMILRGRLGRAERCLMASAAWQAADASDRQRLVEIHLKIPAMGEINVTSRGNGTRGRDANRKG